MLASRRERTLGMLAVGFVALSATLAAVGAAATASVRFGVAVIAVILLARVVSQAARALSAKLGAVAGALLTAGFGNCVELIVTLESLLHNLTTVAKASIVGGVLANALFTLGMAMVVGGVRKPLQTFDRRRAGVTGAMLFLAVSGLVLPSVAGAMRGARYTQGLSLCVAITFVCVYGLGILYAGAVGRKQRRQTDVTARGMLPIVATLAFATALVAVASDDLVSVVMPLAAAWRVAPAFVGLVLLPLVGVAPELFAALSFAARDQMDASVEMAVGSSLQIALFIAPALVLVGALAGKAFAFDFTPVEMAGLVMAAVLTSLVAADGETHWYEGVLVLAAYAIFGAVYLL
ncbi:MAG: hypothetical protein OWT27_01745 [Firmicutes bacterium]|nr:hypothetical protein [Bacillota bacterium]